jgi:hypothetical protein
MRGRPRSVVMRISQEVLTEMIGDTRSAMFFFIQHISKAGLHCLERQYGGRALLNVLKRD